MINRSNRKSLSILLTLALVVNLFLPFVSQQVKAAAVATDLIISEYVEGSSNNKAIELYNGTGKTVNLKEYVVELYANGAATAGNKLTFSSLTDAEAMLANGKTFVIVHSQANADLKAKKNIEDSVTNFNGNDAIVLKHSDQVIDSFGKVGDASYWGLTVKTVDMTLIRNSNITAGDKDEKDDFDPANEWTPTSKDDFSNLGSHTMEGAPSEEPTKVSAVTASVPSSAVKAGTEVELTTSTEEATIYYTVDGSEPTTESTVYSAPIAITADTTIKAIAMADGLDNSDLTEFNYTVLSLKTISEVRTMNPGDFALTSGVVTAVFGKTIYIQDEDAGIVLYGTVSVQPGDEVEAFGKVADYNSLLELEVNSADVKVLGQIEIPAAKELTAAQLSEQYEAMLVKVGKSKVESFTSGNFTAVDANGDSYQVRPGTQEWLEVDTSYDSITGVLGAYRDVYQLIPRNEADIVLDSSFVRPVAATPGAGFIQAGQAVTLNSDTEGATIHYTTDGSEPTANSPVYSNPIVITEDTTIKAFAVKEGLTSTKVYTYDYIIEKEVVRIYDIQGKVHFSKYEGLNVNNVEGVVTYVLGKNDVYIQDLEGDGNDATSDGILVYKSAHGLVPGDVVKVSGQIKEHFIEGYDDRYQVDLPSTEIAASKVEKIRSGETLPTPVIIGKDRTAPKEVIDNDGLTKFEPQEDAIDFYESLEGMLVQVDDAKVVAPQKYGEVVVIPGTMEANTSAGGLRISENDFNPERITIDMNDEKFVAKMGDQFEESITGVMSYGFSNYKVLTKKETLPKLKEGSNQREITSIEPAEDKLTVASYNVENFSPKVDPEKVEKLAQAIVTNLKQPDIIGLTEVQDNDGPTDSGTTDASQSAALLIQTIKDLGGPTYTYTDIAPVDKTDGGQPGGNIRVGFLYNEERVQLMDAPKGAADEAVGFEDGKLTVNPGRIDPTNPAFKSSRKSLAAQFEFQGKSVIVVANHFNSKGGDQPLFGKNQPPVLESELQRMEIAKVVNGFVEDVKAKDPNANVILLGDFNDFEFSNPLQTLKGEVLVNMVEKVPADQRYSYSYQGNAQVLDHILVTKNMERSTTVDMVHINSGFMEEHGRASDHDPLLIQTVLKEPIQLPYDQVFNLVGLKAKKYVVGPPNSLINLDITSKLTDGIWLKNTATINGEGLAHTKVVISPAQKGSIYNLSDAEIKEVLIENEKVAEIYGAENVLKWNAARGVDTSAIKFYDSYGNEIDSPFEMEAELAS
ncbi:chitobiase/beta-hexosaminidase C-terminal domain-containing protein [Mesobacillus subterraneus]|uniref:chitobiase/beta-hexosaminidase C-terminal domain-containing protein n=1 Tax=Mesobacillus subterraneus TaxID=285983 RepID=UPI00203A6BCD|nr:chitobiase/beta-hexosaminidase C-terminal domain-containing protein [Mesobacillus subterraneus]MCM3574421.1 chitobiase/beta-hexosaminidase C-terminal domain-containing protein [Mesobacillus subterraneus]